MLCKNCGEYFKFQRNRTEFCNPMCRKEFREGKFPIYITPSGEEIQLDFDPMKDYDKFLEFKGRLNLK